MIDLHEVKQHIEADPQNWAIHLMDFVDDFRHYKDLSAIAEPFLLTNERWDALLASTVEYLCDEIGMESPEWVQKVPACKAPWFVAGIESLKAIAIVESPLHFRLRKIFVLENFLSRV
ncbi:MAG: hypothetical protein ONB44_21580 [candidate division KSB1 bacterium]|nr:hypothetical protein [candidate division KSB1 bacterium]MDZ7304728.1 hypothetical protein [candidate division KSB1 bacterium]MDZ7312783.1 hypothetical protein [candidate division KSB1 bacterium]